MYVLVLLNNYRSVPRSFYPQSQPKLESLSFSSPAAPLPPPYSRMMEDQKSVSVRVKRSGNQFYNGVNTEDSRISKVHIKHVKSMQIKQKEESINANAEVLRVVKPLIAVCN